MKRIKLFSTLSFLLIAFSMNAIAQQKNANDPAFIMKVEKDAAEVFKNNKELASNQFMPIYLEHLSRLNIGKETQSVNENYPLLSDIILIDKYNPELVRDNSQTFNPETFNALKYAFDYDSKLIKKIRVDHTNYILIIYPKQ